MSAWAKLVADAGEEQIEELNAAMLEIQRETARRCAAKQRAFFGKLFEGQSIPGVAEVMIDLIDPDVEMWR